jgi:hypothetical protein
LIIQYTLSDWDTKINTNTLVNYRYTRFLFINKECICEDNIPQYQLKTTKTIKIINGSSISSSNITEYIHVNFTIGKDYETLIAYITLLWGYLLMLGILWLKRHGIKVYFITIDIQVMLPDCYPHSLAITPHPIKVIRIE